MAYIEINKGKKIILGSNSPRRKKLLEDAGVKFKIRAFPINEDYPVKLKGSEITEYIVEKKALEFKEVKDDEIIITADTIVWTQNEHLGKPKDLVEAKKFLEKLSNMKHEVITSVCFTEKEKQSFAGSHVRSDFCHKSNEILTITISRIQNDQNTNGISIHFENSIGATVDFCHTSTEISTFSISRLQDDQHT